MSYRCPLCLKPLNEKEQLTRHCTFHTDRDESFDCSPHLIPYKIFCPVMDCTSVNQIDDGVFLCHEDCEETNPFWNGEKVDVPGQSPESRGFFDIDFEQGSFSPVQVQHWLLGILRDLPGRREMWFPLMLLRSTGESNGTSRVGRFIELAGAPAAGKTVLAIQAMNPNGYAGVSVPHLNNFIFSRRVGERNEGSFVNFIQTLHLNTLLRTANKELFLPRSTPPGPRNLRVVFFRPIDPGNFGLPDYDRNWKGHAKRLLRMAWRGSKRFIVTDVNASFKEIFGSQGFHPYWHSLAFYDKSGEVDEYENVIRDTLDKVAVVINAKELFGIETGSRQVSEKSIQVAVERLSKGVARKELCYLVITQLDQVQAQMSADDWKTVNRLADDLGQVGKDRSWLARKRDVFFPPRSSTERQLVEKWLSANPTENRQRLKGSLPAIEAIFFIWTENLPASRVPSTQAKIPTSHGLAKFICRCLEIEWEQIGTGKTRTTL